jgi:hypothetical protein
MQRFRSLARQSSLIQVGETIKHFFIVSTLVPFYIAHTSAIVCVRMSIYVEVKLNGSFANVNFNCNRFRGVTCDNEFKKFTLMHG